MSAPADKPDSEIRGIKKVNVARASGIMLAGTMLSRILGFVRAALLIALIGSIGANDAFQAANNLPNIIYNLLASSILSAVLVPQIVRALQRKNSDEFINRLLTLFTTGLLVLTLICVALAPVFITLFAAKLDPGWKQLAITFSYWSLPQVFFYGLYSLWGQFLNAKGSFGPYMWAPVVNNVVGIAGIFIFWQVLGTETDWAKDPSVWTGKPISLLAGISTLGIMVQALILLIPLRRSGFKMRPVWGIRGYGLGEVSRTAMWAFSALCVAQLGFLAISNIAAAANGYASKNHVTIATTTAYNTAFTIYMIPQSMIVTSVVTAMFTSMSAMVAVGQLSRLRNQFLATQQGVGLITALCAALMMVLAVPIMQFIMPTSATASVRAFAQVLAVMALGIPFLGFFNLSQRLLLAFADARSTFLVQIPMTICTLVACGLTVLFLPEKYWVLGAAMGEQLSYVFGVNMTLRRLHIKHLPLQFTRQMWRSLWTIILAAVGSACAGWLVLHYWGPFSGSEHDSALTHMMGAFAKVMVVTTVMTILYLGLLLAWRSPALGLLAVPVWKKLGRARPLPRILAYARQEAVLEDSDKLGEDESGLSKIKSGQDSPGPVGPQVDETSVICSNVNVPDSDTAEASPVEPEDEITTEDEDKVGSDQVKVSAVSYNADGYVNLQSGMNLRFPSQEHFGLLTLGQRLDGDFLPEKDVWTVTDEGEQSAELLVLQGKRDNSRSYYQRLQQVNASCLQDFIWISSDPVDAVLLRAIPARPLSQIVSSGMPPEVIHSLISQVSEGLSQLHQADLAHGAIDPAHILVGADGQVIIRLDVADQNATAHLKAAQTGDGQQVLELLYFLCSGRRDQFEQAKNGEKLAPPSDFHNGSDVDLDAVALAGVAIPSARLCQAIWEQLGQADLEPVAQWLKKDDSPMEKTPEKPSKKPLAMNGGSVERVIKPVLPPAAKIPDRRNHPFVEPAETQAIPLAEMQEMNLNPEEEQAGSGAWIPQAVSKDDSLSDTVTPPNFLDRLSGGDKPAGQIPTLAATVLPSTPVGEQSVSKDEMAGEKVSASSKHPHQVEKQKAKLARKMQRDMRRLARTQQREQQRQQRREKQLSKLSPKDLEPVNATRRVVGSSLVGMAALLVISVLVLIYWPQHNPPVAKPSPSQSQSQKQSSTVTAAKPAEIAGVSSIDAEGNDTEHPELADRMIDGKEDSWWRSRFFRNPKLGDRNGFGVVVTFKDKATISEIRLKTKSQGGKIEVRSLPDSGLPRDGKVLTTGSFADSVTLKLNPATNAHALILWFPELPVDNTGNNRATISEISVS